MKEKMPEYNKYESNQRSWLNKRKGSAHYEVTAEVNHTWVDVYLKLSDCDRKITLDFSYAADAKKTEDGPQYALYKLGKLREAIDKLQAELETAHDIATSNIAVEKERNRLFKAKAEISEAQ